MSNSVTIRQAIRELNAWQQRMEPVHHRSLLGRLESLAQHHETLERVDADQRLGLRIADIIGNFVNSSSRMDEEDFIAGMHRMHRTLQQIAGRMFLEWILGLADAPTGKVDGRNEALSHVATLLHEALLRDGERGPAGRYVVWRDGKEAVLRFPHI